MAAARAVTLTVGIGPLETVSEGVLDSRNVRVSIPAPGGPSAFSVWRGVGNVVALLATELSRVCYVMSSKKTAQLSLGAPVSPRSS